MELNELKDNGGARHRRIRAGRGIGCGKGKTCGRGVKGQKSRSGVAIKGFEGGQMPLHRRLPKRGFTNPNAKVFAEINLGDLQAAFDEGKLQAGQPVTEQALVDGRVIRRIRDGVRVLGNGELTVKAEIEVTGASKSAIAAIEKVGGSVTFVSPVATKVAEA